MVRFGKLILAAALIAAPSLAANAVHNGDFENPNTGNGAIPNKTGFNTNMAFKAYGAKALTGTGCGNGCNKSDATFTIGSNVKLVNSGFTQPDATSYGHENGFSDFMIVNGPRAGQANVVWKQYNLQVGKGVEYIFDGLFASIVDPNRPRLSVEMDFNDGNGFQWYGTWDNGNFRVGEWQGVETRFTSMTGTVTIVVRDLTAASTGNAFVADAWRAITVAEWAIEHPECPRGVCGRLAPDSFTSTVPEPATWALLFGGFVGVGGVARRRRAGEVRLRAGLDTGCDDQSHTRRGGLKLQKQPLVLTLQIEGFTGSTRYRARVHPRRRNRPLRSIFGSAAQ